MIVVKNIAKYFKLILKESNISTTHSTLIHYMESSMVKDHLGNKRGNALLVTSSATFFN